MPGATTKNVLAHDLTGLTSPHTELWRRLNEPSLQPTAVLSLAEGLNPEFSCVSSYFKKATNIRVVNLSRVEKADEPRLPEQGLSLEYIFRTFKKAMTGRHLDGRAFQFTAVRDGALYAYSPFCGKRLKSRDSLLANLNTIFYRFEDREIFYVVVAGIGSGFEKSAMYFPHRELLVTVGADWSIEIDDIIELKARMVCNAALCLSYFQNPAPRTRVVCFGYYHFAHHLWNELTGIQQLLLKGLESRVDKWLALREPLGPITELFPEIPTRKVEKHRDTESLFETILRDGHFAVRVGGDFMNCGLLRRVKKVASQKCDPTTAARIEEAKKTSRPLLWIGVRVGTRAWSNQSEGLCSLILSARQRYPNLGIVFDGFSVPGDKSESDVEYANIVQLENDVVRAIQQTLNLLAPAGPPIVNVVGRSVFDAIAWANAIDFYVSPYGTVQHKVGWMGNKPGIIHTNQALLKNPAKYIWSALEGAVRPRYISQSAVEDLRASAREAVIYRDLSDASESGAGILAGVQRVRGSDEFASYCVDWTKLRDELFEMINSSGRPKTFGREDVAHWLKMRMRRTLRNLFTAFDFSGV